ncbi:hypothetical protein R1flu_024789 [Riccia fluitans]|uniref:Dirigent protein n=1 Tax=Riccia fluitans TaxID=41844 RepID=A0ABD1XVX6_9MARC
MTVCSYPRAALPDESPDFSCQLENQGRTGPDPFDAPAPTSKRRRCWSFGFRPPVLPYPRKFVSGPFFGDFPTFSGATEMAQLGWGFVATFVLFLLPVAVTKADDPNGSTETLTYYVHCTDEVAIVAGPGKETRDLSKLAFGSTLIFDNDVTVGPERESFLIGRREGVAFMDNFAGTNYYLLFTVIFEHHEKYKGTLQVQGTEIGSGDREISIVGGTGDFRGARGYSTFHLYTNNPYPIIEQNFVIYKDSFNYKADLIRADQQVNGLDPPTDKI